MIIGAPEPVMMVARVLGWGPWEVCHDLGRVRMSCNEACLLIQLI